MNITKKTLKDAKPSLLSAILRNVTIHPFTISAVKHL